MASKSACGLFICVTWAAVAIVLAVGKAERGKVLQNSSPGSLGGSSRILRIDANAESKTEQKDCVAPPPLENGKYYPSPRRCPQDDVTSLCQMIPGTLMPNNWVIFYYCDSGYILNSTKPVSVCINGDWTPPLPFCQASETECFSHGDCSTNRTCILGKCMNSCEGLCGFNTECDVIDHRPLCSCKKGYLGNPFRGCILGDPISTKLLLAQSTQVSVLDLTNSKIISTLRYDYQNPKENSPSVAYHFEKKYIFYAGSSQIFRDEIKTDSLARVGEPKAVVDGVGVDSSAKLAVDWVHDTLYWMSHTSKTVEMSDLDGNNKTLLTKGLTFWWNLNNLVVEPYAGYLFLVSQDSLLRMNLDGSNLTALHLKGYNNRGVYVLTVDTHKKRIYYSSWDLRNAVPFIDSCDYEGKNEKNIPIGDRWGEIHAVDVFRDILYFGHFKRGQSDEVWSVDLTNPTPTPILIKTVEKGFLGFKAYHPDVQKECKRQEPIK